LIHVTQIHGVLDTSFIPFTQLEQTGALKSWFVRVIRLQGGLYRELFDACYSDSCSSRYFVLPEFSGLTQLEQTGALKSWFVRVIRLQGG
jgi:hypothetical protein